MLINLLFGLCILAPPQTTYIILINLGRRNHEQTKEHLELLQAPDWVYYV
jgi:hypothetical protein